MGRSKQGKFLQNEEAWNVVQEGKENFETIKGKWHSDFFKNDNDLIIELGCGRGEYTMGLSENYADRNFVGIDIKGSRIWKGSQQALANNVKNVGFLRTQIQFLDKFFEPGEFAGAWITFPDPQPKKTDANKRLTSPRYLDLYKSLVKPGGTIWFKTDCRPLFDYTLEVLKDYDIENFEHTFDLYESPLKDEHFGIQTRYELKFMAEGHKINYLRFNFKVDAEESK